MVTLKKLASVEYAEIVTSWVMPLVPPLFLDMVNKVVEVQPAYIVIDNRENEVVSIIESLEGEDVKETANIAEDLGAEKYLDSEEISLDDSNKATNAIMTRDDADVEMTREHMKSRMAY